MLDRKFHHRKNNGVHQANERENTGKWATHQAIIVPCVLCFAVAAADVYFFHQSCKSNGPAGMKLEYRYAEFKNLAFDL